MEKSLSLEILYSAWNLALNLLWGDWIEDTQWHWGSFTISNGNSVERRRRTHGGRDVRKQGDRHHWCPKALHIQGWSNSCCCCLHLLFLPFFSRFQLVIHSRYNTNQNAWFDTTTFNKGVRVTDRWQNEQTTQSSSNLKLKKIVRKRTNKRNARKTLNARKVSKRTNKPKTRKTINPRKVNKPTQMQSSKNPKPQESKRIHTHAKLLKP